MSDTSLGGASWDTVQTERNLRAWLLARGYCQPEHGSFVAALLHVTLHGEGDGPRCNVEPCRAAGASFALAGLALFHGQLQGGSPILVLAESVEKTRAKLLRLIEDLEYDVAQFLNFSHPADATHNLSACFAHQHELLCLEPDRRIESLKKEAESMRILAITLRGLLASSQLRVPWRAGGREQVLLTAVCQHLWHEGFSYEEIADLVVDGGSGREAAVRRVVTRVRRPDAREFVPYRPSASRSA